MKINLIKDCPFCGAHAKLEHTHDQGYVIECSNSVCQASSKVAYPIMEDPRRLLMEAWNKRVYEHLLEWAETLLCNSEHPEHCDDIEWKLFIKQWRDEKHGEFLNPTFPFGHNIRTIFDYVKEKAPDKISKKWVLWMLLELSGPYELNPEYFRVYSFDRYDPEPPM